MIYYSKTFDTFLPLTGEVHMHLVDEIYHVLASLELHGEAKYVKEKIDLKLGDAAFVRLPEGETWILYRIQAPE